MLLKIRWEAALFKDEEKQLHPHLKEPKRAEDGEDVWLVLHRLIEDPPSLATLATPGVNRRLEGGSRRGAQAADYIMAAESQTKGTVPRCLTCFLIPPNKLLQMNIRYSSENSLQPRCTNSWKGEKNQLAALAACRIISSRRLREKHAGNNQV